MTCENPRPVLRALRQLHSEVKVRVVDFQARILRKIAGAPTFVAQQDQRLWWTTREFQTAKALWSWVSSKVSKA